MTPKILQPVPLMPSIKAKAMPRQPKVVKPPEPPGPPPAKLQAVPLSKWQQMGICPPPPAPAAHVAGHSIKIFSCFHMAAIWLYFRILRVSIESIVVIQPLDPFTHAGNSPSPKERFELWAHMERRLL